MSDKHPLYDFESAPTQLYTYADDACPAMFIKYKGTSQSCLISVDATSGDITSLIGVLGAEAADPNFTIGATPGTIDVSQAAANTAGEVVDFINSLADYECIPWGMLRADDMDITNGALVGPTTGVQAKSASSEREAGAALFWDTSLCFHHSIVISNMHFGGKSMPGGVGDEGIYDEHEAINKLFYFTIDPTYGGTASLKLYEITRKTEVEKASFTLAASTNPTTVAFKDSWGCPYVAKPGARILVRMTDNTSLTTLSTVGFGQSVPKIF